MVKRRKKSTSRKTAKKGSKATPATYFLLFLIILSALFFRLFQPDWYNDRQFHPDERWIISNAVPQLSYPDKPIGLQYGSLPLYLLSFYKNAVDAMRSNVLRGKDMNKFKIGGARVISGLVDTGTIIFIFMICLLLFDRKVALLASALLSFTVLNIHSSHFFTVDTWVTLFITITVYFSARIYKYGKMMDYILAGVFYGAAIASKTAALPLAAVIFTGHILYFISIKGSTKAAKRERINSWINLGTAVLVTGLAFFIFMPHAVLDSKKFLHDQNYQRRILVTGEGDVPYNRQYLKTTPYIYYMKNLVMYTMGIPYGSVALFAFFFYMFLLAYRAKQRKPLEKEIIMVLSWMLPYFIIVGYSFGKFNRYMMPFTPFLAILTAKLVYDMYGWFKNKKIASVLKCIVLFGALFYALAHNNIYRQSHPWIQASRWIYKNVPAATEKNGQKQRTVVLNEMWGDDLPVYADGKSIGVYQNLKWALQEPDSPRKINELSDKLYRSDYVMMADRRAYGTYLRLPERYPINYFYYSTMMNNPEKLGFKLVHETAVYPSLFGITIKDDKADESFQLYDHPHVFVFKNEKYYPPEELKAMIIAGQEKVKSEFVKETKGAENPNIGMHRDITKGVMPYISVFMWYILIQVLAFIFWPAHFSLFKNLKDKGYGLAKVSGLFVFAWLNWMLVASGIWRFYQMNLWILLIALFALSVMYYMKNREEITAFSRENKAHILRTETVFLGAYMFFILIKLWCPDIHNVAGHGYNGGGEPMGMAYLSGIYNDVKFPPHDPWLAGFTLNYYYWGQLILATLSKTLGYLPRVTYNLSLAILFALSFTAAFTFTYNMTGKYKYGIFSGFLLAMAGNFHTLVYFFNSIVNANNIQHFINSFFRFEFIWDPTRIYPHPAITEVPFFSYLYGDLHAHNIVIPFTVLLAALVLNVFKSPNTGINAFESFGANIKERIFMFLMFSLGLGSMMAINTWSFPPVFIFMLMSFTAAGLFLYFENYKKPRRAGAYDIVKAAGSSAVNYFASALIILAAAYLLYIPFHSNFVSPYKPAIRLIQKAERAGLMTMFKYFSIFFFVIFTYLFYKFDKVLKLFDKEAGLFKLRMRHFDLDRVFRHIGRVFDKISDKPELLIRFIAGCVILITGLLLSLFVQPTFGVLFIMVVFTGWFIVSAEDKDERLAAILLFTALCTIWGVEIFFVADGRMNTVFKFYMVVWILLSLSVPYLLFKSLSSLKKIFKKKETAAGLFTAGVALALLAVMFILKEYDSKHATKYFMSLFVVVAAFGGAALFILKDRIGKYIFAGSLVLILLPVIIYPFLGAFIKMDICSRGFKIKPHIDGMQYMRELKQRGGARYDFDKFDYQTMQWMNKNFRVIEPVLEAPGERMYSGVSRISIFTGMPTLVGWGYQVGQQSGRGREVSNATRVTNMIYREPDPRKALAMLKDAGIKYVYVGAVERGIYPGTTDKFTEIGHIIYQNEGARLYKIID